MMRWCVHGNCLGHGPVGLLRRALEVETIVGVDFGGAAAAGAQRRAAIAVADVDRAHHGVSHKAR